MTSRLTRLTIFLFTFNFQLTRAQDLDTVTIYGRRLEERRSSGP